jgi:hypothetical protein
MKCLRVLWRTLSRRGLVAVAAALLAGAPPMARADEPPARSSSIRDLQELNEGLHPGAEVYDYPLGTVAFWAAEEFRECLEPPDDLFRPLFDEHPKLAHVLESKWPYLGSYGAGMYVRPANVSKARRAVEASLPASGEWDFENDFALNALWELANLLRYSERRGLGLIERCA